MDVVRNDPVTISRRAVTYTVVTNNGTVVLARGTLKICGDFVIIDEAVFHRPDSVKEQ